MTAPQKVLLPLADGFEEIEAVTVIDVLRRAGIDVVVADLGGPDDERSVRGSHHMRLATETSLDDVEFDDFEAVALAGGIPGATTLRDDPRVIAALKYMQERGRWVAAVCAAPIALAAAGLLEGERATSYPAFRDRLGGADVVADERVVISGRVITSVGPGTALDFALCLVGVLCGPELAEEIATAMIAGGLVERVGACAE
jgi:4-methyl-5(b-hydroxyethyl)-thiazole monophosphate biosynthesis